MYFCVKSFLFVFLVVKLAEYNKCKHQAAICNALFSYFAGSDMERAVYYFKVS